MSAIWSALGLGLAVVSAAAAPVTFQVNMEVQATLGNFDPASDTVELHGSFNGWGAGITLEQIPAGPALYQGTVDLRGAPGSAVQYKFVINQGGALVWEGNVGPGGAQNRTVNVPDSAQTLPVVYFNNQTSPPGVIPVTFQVNMAIQKEMGNFDPAAHLVEVHGEFDNWGVGAALSASATNANIYVGTVEVAGSPGTTSAYKFVVNRDGPLFWEGNVGPGGAFGNRTFTLAQSAQTLPVVYFNNVEVNPGAGIPVTFAVSMAVQTALGYFDPASGTVTLAGAFNNWSTSETPMTNSPTDVNLYLATVNIKASPGSSVAYKFVMNGSGWESGDNRAFTLASSAQTLPVAYFDRLDNLGALSITVVGDQATVSWTAGPFVRLQSAANVAGLWVDVPDSLGQSSMTFTVEEGAKFFRLAAP
jgi:hypothetical protein